MKCDCGGTERKQKVTKMISLGRREIFVENLDAWVCDKCGETYFDGEMLLKLERKILKQETQPA